MIVSHNPTSDANDAQMFMDAYSVTAQGNFEGNNILHVARDHDVIPAMYHLNESEVELRLNEARRKLFLARERRVKPTRDEKVLTSWNGLILAAFAEAARAFGRDDYRAIAERNADFVVIELRDNHGRLQRSWKDGTVHIVGFAQWLIALDFAVGPTREIAIVSERAEAQTMLEVVFRGYYPNQVVALAPPQQASRIPLLYGRVQRDGRATAYLCQHFACQLPVTEPDALAAQLNG
jgi:uncharacterized protein YyaL (SSP411 family)